MKRNYIKGTKFYGKEVSEEGLKYKRVDYATLANAFDAVLCNNIVDLMGTGNMNWDVVNGSEYDEESECYEDVFQYFIIDYAGYNILSYYTDEIVYYCDELDMYVWGVTHYGTAWDYVLTGIEIVD